MTPQVHSSKIVYRGFFNLQTDRLSRSDGQMLDYTSVVLPWSAAIVIAETVEGLMILNSEYRHPTGEMILGCPGGRLEKGEEPLAGGQREFYEETGYWSDELTLLGSCYPFPSLCNQKIYFILAKNAVWKGNQKCDPFEFIKTELMSETELRSTIRAGSRPIDGILLTALSFKSLYT